MLGLRFFTLIVLSVLLNSCAVEQTKNIVKAQTPNIVPKPVSLEVKDNVFEINSEIELEVSQNNPGVWKIAKNLSNLLGEITGERPKILKQSKKPHITLEIDTTIASNEGYHLFVDQKKVIIKGGSAKGVFYGVQTFKQLMPAFVFSSQISEKRSLLIKCLEIKDYPRFSYRGMHLDVARHFYSIDYIKKYIDLIALHKMNTFHWHLTDDQGWRIEIKQYPKLTEIGGWRKETLVGHTDKSQKYDGVRHGGFYTQKEIREVVEYARGKYVTIIPEIEMPGHALAALAAYSELGCNPKEYEVATAWGVFDDILCPKEETFTFLQNVLDEVIVMFPGTYIHIGGDEVPKKRWKECANCQALIKEEVLDDEAHLQSYFVRRMGEYLQSKGRKLIGWEEIFGGALSEESTIMSWRGLETGINAAKQGYNVIMTPLSHVYFDYYQSKKEGEPLSIGGFTPLKKVYDFEPIPNELTEDERNYVLGSQGNVWTEYISNVKQLEYMVFPRMCALAEVVWSSSDKNWDDFSGRLATHLKRLDKLEVNYAKQEVLR